MMTARFRFLVLGLTIILTQRFALGKTPMTYPVTARVEQNEDYHGTTVNDPYRWLEQDVRESADVAKWVEQQNKVTFQFFESIPSRKAIEERLKELWDYPKYSAPFKAGDYYFFFKNNGLQNQSVLYVQRGLEGEPRVLLDPEYLVPGRHGGAGRVVRQRTRPVSRLRSCGIGLRLAIVAPRRRRDRTTIRRPPAVGQIQQCHVDSG